MATQERVFSGFEETFRKEEKGPEKRSSHIGTLAL